MAKYQIHVFCNECAETHPMGILISLNDGPANKASLNDTYAGKDLPPEIANFINNKTMCPNTKRMFTQQDNNQIFLVAVGD